MREVRFLSGQIEFRSGCGSNSITGYAAKFDALSDPIPGDGGSFREVIRKGAFSRAIREEQDVRCLFNHDDDKVLGRTKAGTLTLSEDNVGLRFMCDLPNTSFAQDLRESIRRGDISQCSFGFQCLRDNWIPSGNASLDDPDTSSQYMVRELHDVNLLDVSPVTYPAYPQTEVSARSLFPEGQIVVPVVSFDEFCARLNKRHHEDTAWRDYAKERLERAQR